MSKSKRVTFDENGFKALRFALAALLDAHAEDDKRSASLRWSEQFEAAEDELARILKGDDGARNVLGALASARAKRRGVR